MNQVNLWFHAAIIVAILAVILFVGSCDSDSATESKPQPDPILASLTDFSDCLDLSMSASDESECFEYSFDSSGVLTVLHHNAGFNCCPDSIYADIEIDGQTITFDEHEGLSMPCHCLCLYDIEYRLENVTPEIYTLVFNDSYIHTGDSMLTGTIDLEVNPEGSYCQERGYYPWPEPTAGYLIDYSDCLTYNSAHVPQTCVHFEYDGYYLLELSHINAWYNCCLDSISVAFSFDNDSIIIGETEWLENGGCDCICPVNIDMRIENLQPGEYTLVIGPATVDPAARQSMLLDLRHQITYTYCFDE